jgi:glucose uptake protein GlcU
MNAITMIRAATVLLTIGALGGILMAIIRFSRSQNPPPWLAMLHGFLAAAGVTLLLYAALTVGIPQLTKIGLVLLLIAAMGGAVLNLRYQWQRELLPPSWLIGHAVLAVIGFTLVLLSAWRTM